MVFSNEKISSKQLYRMIVLSTIGISCFMVTDISVKYADGDGLLCVMGASVITLLYSVLILYLCEKTNWNYRQYASAHFNRLISAAIDMVFGVKYLIMLIFTILVILRSVKRELLTEISYPAVFAVVLVLVAYSMTRGVEARARLSECMIYFITVPVIVFAVLGIRGTNRYYLAPFYEGNVAGIIKGSIILFMLFSPVEMILFMSDRISAYGVENAGKTPSDNGTGIKKSIFGGIITVSIINIIYYLIVVGNLSINIVNAKNDSLLRLARILKLPYLMFEKQGGMFMMFFVISMFFSVFCLTYHCNAMFTDMYASLKGRVSLSCRKNRYAQMMIVLFTVIGVTVGAVRISYFNNVIEAKETRVQIEYRRYADCMIIDYNEAAENYKVLLSFTNDLDENEFEVYELKSLRELKQESSQRLYKRLDLSHIEVIVLTNTILKKQELYKDTMMYIENEEELSDNLNICVTKQSGEKFAENVSGFTTAPGIYIGKMLENNIRYAKTKFLKLSLVAGGTEKNCILSTFRADEEGIAYTGNIIVDDNGYVASYTGNNSKINELVAGEKGYSINLENNETISVEKNDYYININIVGGDTINAKVIYSGDVTCSGEMSAEQVNAELEKIIYERLNILMEEYNCDILNIYEYLAVEDKDLWKKYKNDRTKMYEKVYFDVDTRYNIS